MNVSIHRPGTKTYQNQFNYKIRKYSPSQILLRHLQASSKLIEKKGAERAMKQGIYRIVLREGHK